MLLYLLNIKHIKSFCYQYFYEHIQTEQRKYKIFELSQLLDIFIQKVNSNRGHCNKFSHFHSVVIFLFSMRIIIFVRKFHYKKHYLLHRLLYFIRAVYLPTSTVYRNVGVGDKSCSTLIAFYRQ